MNTTLPNTSPQQEIDLQNAPEYEETKGSSNKENLLYSVEDVPPWYHIILFSIQHYLALFGGLLVKTYLIAPVLCIGPEDPARAHLVSTCGFVSGLATLLQATIGVRLPIVQTPGVVFLLPVVAHLTSPEWKCPDDFVSEINSANSTIPKAESDEMWQVRMREVQGAILVASIIELIVGLSGLITYVTRLVTPLVITPVLALTGLSLFENATKLVSSSWGIAVLTMVLLILFSYMLDRISIPCCAYSRKKGCTFKPFQFFKFYPVLLAMIISWLLSLVLTHYSVYPVGSKARTDYNTKILSNSPWFRIPYPGQWGLPSVSFAGVFGMLVAVIASIVDTIGDYYACVMLSGAPSPPAHALSRGVFFDGIGGVLSALWGTGNSSTSSSGNIAVIGITKVASRRVVQGAAILMMILGTFSKFGALFVTIPEPIIGGVFFVLFSVNTSVGLANLKYVDLDSSRNLLAIGFPLFCGIAIPKWLDQNSALLHTGVKELDSILLVILRNNVFVGGFLGLLLDQLLPGTDEERGITKWEEDYKIDENATLDEINKCYDLPFGMSFLRKFKFTQYIAISPTYKPWNCKPCSKSDKKNTSANANLKSPNGAENPQLVSDNDL